MEDKYTFGHLWFSLHHYKDSVDESDNDIILYDKGLIITSRISPQRSADAEVQMKGCNFILQIIYFILLYISHILQTDWNIHEAFKRIP